MRCPKCINTELRKRAVKKTGTVIDQCPSCTGIWFDRGELETVMNEAVSNLRIPATAKESSFLFCPHCLSPLHEFQYPRTYVTVDVCRKCRGLWIDAGEFKEIKAVRRSLERSGTLDLKEEDSEPTGVKGALLRLIDSAIDQLIDSF